MTRFLTLAAAALIAAPAFAAQHSEMSPEEGMSQLMAQAQDTLESCDLTLEDSDMMNLTMQQVQELVLADPGDCPTIEAIVQ